MNKLADNAVYSMDIATIIDFEGYEYPVYRLRYRWYGDVFTMLFNSQSEMSEYVDDHHQSWMRNFHRNQPPDPQADSKA